MMFRIGQKVRIVHSPTFSRIGTIATVVSELRPILCWQPGDSDSVWRTSELPDHLMGHELDLVAEGCSGVAYPPEFLEPIDDGREPAEWTAELRKLCRVKENA